MTRIEKEVVVNAPADTVYQVWRNFENFPNFMDHVRSVEEIAPRRTHWRGREGEWEAEVVRDEPGRAIAWESIDTPESPVHDEGSIELERMGDATFVRVEMEHEPLRPGILDRIGGMFRNPERELEHDLMRFKERVEHTAGYQRATARIAGTAPPAHADDLPPPAEAALDAAGIGMTPEEAERFRRATEAKAGKAMGAGTGDERPSPGRPTTTSTPGGTLGAPDERELKRDQGKLSDKGGDLR